MSRGMLPDLLSNSGVSFNDQRYRTRSVAQPTTKRVMDGSSEEFYPTPPWVTRALLRYETFTGDTWECACGDGAMSEELISSGLKVYSSDLYNRGYGDAGIDFLKCSKTTDNIITNPPYNLAGYFVLHALNHSRRKAALLMRLAFLESAERYRKIFALSPPSRVWAFSERITFYPKGAVRKGTGTTAYAWLVWDKESADECKLGWIAPGQKPNSRRGSSALD